MNNKNTVSVTTSQLFAPMPLLHCNEQTKSLYFCKNGKEHPFKEITPSHFALLLNKLNTNRDARILLGERRISPVRKVELYTFFSLKNSTLKSN